MLVIDWQQSCACSNTAVILVPCMCSSFRRTHGFMLHSSSSATLCLKTWTWTWTWTPQPLAERHPATHPPPVAMPRITTRVQSAFRVFSPAFIPCMA
jgi:hypothetical protein